MLFFLLQSILAETKTKKKHPNDEFYSVALPFASTPTTLFIPVFLSAVTDCFVETFVLFSILYYFYAFYNNNTDTALNLFSIISPFVEAYTLCYVPVLLLGQTTLLRFAIALAVYAALHFLMGKVQKNRVLVLDDPTKKIVYTAYFLLCLIHATPISSGFWIMPRGLEVFTPLINQCTIEYSAWWAIFIQGMYFMLLGLCWTVDIVLNIGLLLVTVLVVPLIEVFVVWVYVSRRNYGKMDARESDIYLMDEMPKGESVGVI